MDIFTMYAVFAICFAAYKIAELVIDYKKGKE